MPSEDGVTIQGCATKYFANSGTLRTDDCAQHLRNKTNNHWADHQLYNPRKCVSDPKNDEITKFAMCQPNLRFKKGVGNVDTCNVDDDSRLRKDGYDVRRKRFQLFPREFLAVPDMGRGDFLPDTDSMLSRGAQKEYDKRPLNAAPGADCTHLSELGYANYNLTPMIPCLKESIQDPKNIVPNWTWGGMSSRMINRSPEFLEACGYQLIDEKKHTWTKKT